MNLEENLLDVTAFDPSMAGAAGGSALVTTTTDLAHFLQALLAGELFKETATLKAMLHFENAPYDGGAVGYGLGIQKFRWGSIEAIGHAGGTAGYRSVVVYLPAYPLSLASVQTTMDSNPIPLLLPALSLLIPEKAQELSEAQKKFLTEPNRQP